MAWQLEINHIDVSSTGDATLIVVREVAPLAVPGAPRIRSVLIDGGRANNAPAVYAYVAMRILPAATLTAIIVTHYDQDHVNGMTWILRQAGLCNAVTIYDQGWPAGPLADTYVQYVRAINGRNNNGAIPGLAVGGRTRATAAVLSDNAAPTLTVTATVPGPAVPVAINRNANWLLIAGGLNPPPADVFWGNGVVPWGAPTMRFIAANGYVRIAGGGIGGPYLGFGADPKNEKSLAVEVAFGTFRYYAGGDIETGQEAYIQTLLNNADDAAGRVVAMKASHHGANTATSRAFVDQLKPAAAFISCGTANWLHPAMETVNILDGYAANPTGANPVALHAPAPPAPPNRPVHSYLTGYETIAPIVALPPGAPPPGPVSRAGTAGLTAGDPVAPLAIVPGHIRVTVNAAQSVSDVRGALYLAVHAAAVAAATAAGVPGMMTALAAGPAADAAAEAALTSGSAAAAANAFLTNLGMVAAATQAGLTATAQIGLGSNGTVTAAAVTLGALGFYATAAQAAAAGAAAGVVVGGDTGPSVQNAVSGALIAALNTAGLGTGAVAGLAAAAALNAAPAAGQFSVVFHDRNALANPATITHR